jgi:hypothetical protein
MHHGFADTPPCPCELELKIAVLAKVAQRLQPSREQRNDAEQPDGALRQILEARNWSRMLRGPNGPTIAGQTVLNYIGVSGPKQA